MVRIGCVWVARTLWSSDSLSLASPGPDFGLIIRVDRSKFMLVGLVFHACFASRRQGFRSRDFLFSLEKVWEYHTEILVTGRTLNGNETRSSRFGSMSNRRPDLWEFTICIMMPARSSITGY